MADVEVFGLQLFNTAKLRDDWNGHGAKPVNPEVVTAALRFVAAMSWQAFMLPNLVPTVGGGVQLEWSFPECGLEVEFTETRMEACIFDDATNVIAQTNVDLKDMDKFLAPDGWFDSFVKLVRSQIKSRSAPGLGVEWRAGAGSGKDWTGLEWPGVDRTGKARALCAQVGKEFMSEDLADILNNYRDVPSKVVGTIKVRVIGVKKRSNQHDQTTPLGVTTGYVLPLSGAVPAAVHGTGDPASGNLDGAGYLRPSSGGIKLYTED